MRRIPPSSPTGGSPARSDGAVLIGSIFLLLGGVPSRGAAVAGGEWRAGTITTVLTWEPRRVRLNLARTAACGILAFVVGVVLQVVFLASLPPGRDRERVRPRGPTPTGGVDSRWRSRARRC